MPANPLQIHILITSDSGRTAERTYLRDEDGWAMLSRLTNTDGNAIEEQERALECTNEALMDAMFAVHSAFGMMREDGDAPIPALVPVDTRPQDPGVMN